MGWRDVMMMHSCCCTLVHCIIVYNVCVVSWACCVCISIYMLYQNHNHIPDVSLSWCMCRCHTCSHYIHKWILKFGKVWSWRKVELREIFVIWECNKMLSTISLLHPYNITLFNMLHVCMPLHIYANIMKHLSGTLHYTSANLIKGWDMYWYFSADVNYALNEKNVININIKFLGRKYDRRYSSITIRL